jgi:hypothetical protein
MQVILLPSELKEPITAAARSVARNFLALSNNGIVNSNPTPGMYFRQSFFCVGVVLCVGKGLGDGLISLPSNSTNCQYEP